MRLHNYLETVLGSKVKIKILRELFKYAPKSFTIRELAESIKDVTHTGVRKALGDLQGANLVIIEHHGQSNLLRLNKESKLYDALWTLFLDVEARTSYLLTQDLKKSIPNSVISCAVFGSVARGTEKPDSDVDVLFITDDKEAVQKFVEEKLRFFIAKYGNVITPYVMSKFEFVKKKNTLFVKGVLEKYRLIKGEDLWKLIQ